MRRFGRGVSGKQRAKHCSEFGGMRGPGQKTIHARILARVLAGFHVPERREFRTNFAGVALVSYMSSLTTLGYTAMQYPLLGSNHVWFGKIAKGFSSVLVETLAAKYGLMTRYQLFFPGAGAIGIPAILLPGAIGSPPDRAPCSPRTPEHVISMNCAATPISVPL
jgi:hypothetical protein